MLIVAIAWIYVVLMMVIAEANAANGSLLGAFFTFVLYGVLPLSVLLYLMYTPTRRRLRRAADAAEVAAAQRRAPPSADETDPGRESPGDTVAPERKEI